MALRLYWYSRQVLVCPKLSCYIDPIWGFNRKSFHHIYQNTSCSFWSLWLYSSLPFPVEVSPIFSLPYYALNLVSSDIYIQYYLKPYTSSCNGSNTLGRVSLHILWSLRDLVPLSNKWWQPHKVGAMRRK